MDAENFRGRLRELRSEAGLTQQQLADRAGIHRVEVAKLEGGDRSPTWETVIALCRALGVGCDAFLQPPSPGLAPPAAGRPRKAAGDAEGPPAGESAPDAVEGKPKRQRGKRG